jgi:uncharacterized protein
MTRAAKLRCPICKKAVKGGDAQFPFCSERCRIVDLGKWASGEYVIPSPVADSEEGLGEFSSQDTDGNRDS